MLADNPNILLMLALSVLLCACVPLTRKVDIRPEYTEVQSCQSNKNANELTSDLLTHASIRDKSLYPDSEITVFLIENVHNSSFEATDTVPNSIRRIQSNIYYTLSELDRLYCLEFIGHEDVGAPIMDIRDNPEYDSLRTELLNEYGHMEESKLVEALVAKGTGGAVIYSLLHLNHKVFIVDNSSPRELTLIVEILKLEEQLSSYVRKKYKDKLVIDRTFTEYKNKSAELECELFELFVQRGFDTGQNIIDLAKELSVTKLAIVYGAAHTKQLQSALSDSHVSHFVIRPYGVGFIPTLDQVFSHCPQ